MTLRNMLNENVLVLNRLWQAINVCTAERAFTLLYMGHAEVVVENGGNFQTFDFHEWRDFTQNHDGDDLVHTVSFKIRIPRVILLLFFDRLPHKEVKFTRHNIFERDRNTCQYCGKHFDRRDLNLYHVIPREVGYFIPAITEKTDQRCVKVNGQDRCKIAIQTNNVEVDDRGYIYIVDRANTGQ